MKLHPTIDLVDLSAEDAVRVAWAAHKNGDSDALDFLDRSLRRRVLGYVLRGDVELSSLQTALVAAIDQALDLPELPWGPRWESLLDVLEAGRQMPSLERGTVQLRILLPRGLGVQVLRQLQSGGLRPSDLAARTLPTTEASGACAQIVQTLDRLVDAGLIEQATLGGNHWVSLSPLGRRMLKLLGENLEPAQRAGLLAADAPQVMPSTDSERGR